MTYMLLGTGYWALVHSLCLVGCLLGYSSCLVVWIPLFLDPSDGVFGRFDLAALCGCRTLNFCLFVLELLLLSDSPHLGENVFGINCMQSSGIYAVALLFVCRG